MMPPCSTALLLFLTSVGTLGFMSRAFAFPVLMGLAGVAVCTFRYQRPVRPAQHRAFVVALVIAFVLKWALSPPLRIGGLALPLFSIGIVEYNLAYNVAQAIIVYQLFLLAYGKGVGRPYLLPLYAAAVMTMAGTIPTPMSAATRDVFFVALSLIATVVTGLCFSADTVVSAAGGRARQGLMIGLFAIICFAGWGLGKAIYRYSADIDRFLGRVAPPMAESAGTVGFSNDGRIGTIDARRQSGGSATALRVFSNVAPAYLRGKAFDKYEMAHWQTISEGAYLSPLSDSRLPETNDAFLWYALQPSTDLSTTLVREMRVQPTFALRNVLFTPLDTAYLGVSAPSVMANVHGIPSTPPLAIGEAYRILATRAPGLPPSARLRAELTALPGALDPRFAPLARQLADKAPSDSDKIQAVVEYLGEQCTYALGQGPGRSLDPVGAFVFDTKKGHCELFASACAILLRHMGVPCRYVTGFVPTEKSALGGYWIARNRDAHAWVEAYVEGGGWVTVEATPAAGVPAEEKAGMEDLLDYLQYLPQAFLASIRDGSIRAMLMAVWHALCNTKTSVLAAAAIALSVLVFLYRRVRRPGRKGARKDPHAAAMRRHLARMDRRLAAIGLARAVSETLHAFAGRVDAAGQPEAAEWYRVYAAIRYDVSREEAGRTLPGYPALRARP